MMLEAAVRPVYNLYPDGVRTLSSRTHEAG